MKNKNELKMFIITFFNSDNDSVKYIVNRSNYYEAKNEAETLKYEINNESLGYKIKSYDIKENS